jgi:hypothetical protein
MIALTKGKKSRSIIENPTASQLPSKLKTQAPRYAYTKA